jgi:hypothetical protein
MKIFIGSLVVTVFVMVAGFPGTSNAATGFLKGDRTDGMSKVCYYDVLGERYELNLRSTDLCPFSYEFQVAPRPAQNNNFNDAGQGGKTGFLKGHQTQGMSQVCYYDVLGEVREVTISATALCPLTMKF